MADDVSFDRRFVTAALLIGFGYAVLIVALATILGKEAAGVAGVALTAMATGVFKQFETLRFKQVEEAAFRDLEIARLDRAFIALLLTMMFGTNMIFALLVLFPIVSGLGIEIDVYNMPTWQLLLFGAFNTGTYFLSGLLAGRTLPGVRLYYVAVAAFGATVLSGITAAIPVLIANSKEFLQNPEYLAAFVIGLFRGFTAAGFYVLAAVTGAWLVFRRRRKDGQPIVIDSGEQALVHGQ